MNFTLSHPKREILDFLAPVSVARFRNIDLYGIPIFRNMSFPHIPCKFLGFSSQSSFSLQGGNVALANGIYKVFWVISAKIAEICYITLN